MRFIKTSTLLIGVQIFFLSSVLAQIPAGYYNTATGLTGAPLKTALYNIIKNHTVQSYPLWTWYDNTDLRTDGKIWDIYSDNCNFVYSTDQCGSYSNICDCYNNEHSFPKSWFSDVSPMNSDIFHLYPTDGKVNGMRSNYPYGVAAGGTVYGNGKLGTCTYPGYSGTVFEPADQYKGDLARTYFYMVTRYENVVVGWETDDPNGDAILNGTTFPCFEPWALSLLITWNAQDPVSQKEIDRNNKIYSLVQHNRNPYIDHPEWVTAIWGSGSGINYIENQVFISAFPNPTSKALNINVVSTNKEKSIISIFQLDGKLMYSVTSESMLTEIDLSDLPDGIYMLNVQGQTFSKFEKIIVIK